MKDKIIEDIIDIHDSDAEKYLKETPIGKYLSQLRRTSNGEILIDSDKDKIIGVVFVGDKKDKGFISNLWVNPTYRRHGYGTKLLTDAIKKFGGKDLTVRKANLPAVKLYRKYGFVNKEFNDPSFEKYYWMQLPKGYVSEGSDLNSEIDEDFKDKKQLDLMKFKQKPLTQEVIDRYSDSDPLMRHIDLNAVCLGFFDGSKLVCYVCVNQEGNGKNLITAFEVMRKYRGHGLSEQLLDFAVRQFGVNRLTVSKFNVLAIRIYKDYGFKMTPKSKKEVASGEVNNYEMRL